MLVGLIFFALAVRFQNTDALVLLVLLALTVLLIAGAVMGVDEWDRGKWWRSVIHYLRVPLVALLLLGIGLVSYTSVGTARSAALRMLGTPVQNDGLAGTVSLLEEGGVAVLASPGADVVEVQVKPTGEDVAGLCGTDVDVRYRRLGWTPDVITLSEQRRATSTVSGAQAFSVITAPSDAYSVRTGVQSGAAVRGPCF